MDKKEYLDAVKKHLEEKIDSINSALSDTQASANSDTKSSAGDKHETSRAMAHLENERLANQLNQLQLQMEKVNSVNPEILSEIVSFGSVVKTENSTFFISTGIGKVSFDSGFFFAIGTNSPVGQNLIGKKVGDEIKVGNKLDIILMIS